MRPVRVAEPRDPPAAGVLALQVADGAGAAVAISAVDLFPFVGDAEGGDPGLPEGRAEELDEAGVGELVAVCALARGGRENTPSGSGGMSLWWCATREEIT